MQKKLNHVFEIKKIIALALKHVMGVNWNCLTEAILMGTQNMLSCNNNEIYSHI